MSAITKIVILAVCAAICASQPVDKLPILKELPSSEIGIGTPEQEITIECATVDKDPNVKYSWLKDGKPYTPHANVVKRVDEGTLIFKKPDRSDEGQYQCLAQTEYGVASTRVITLKKRFMDPPNFTLKKHKPIEGKPYKLDCTIPRSYPEPEITWFRKSLTDANDNKPVFGQRLTISDQGDLYFSNVTKEDAKPGYKYVCYGKAPDSGEIVELAEHILEDVLPNKEPINNDVIEQYVTNEKTVKAGDSTYLYCIYGGNPLAHPDWFKDGKNVNNGPKDRVTRHNKSVGKRLVIKDVWVSDEGEYTCVVDNEVGKSQKHTMHLHVVSAPQFLKKGQPKLIVKSGQDFTIPCEAAGVPAPELSWSLNAQRLPSERAALEPQSRGNSSSAELRVRRARESDAGYYGCRATNDHGDVYSETLVSVQ
ncbi:unnamed protein product [Euphydryas editha]|uniref:Hemolin n=1 Tax=Euphydryas editha TaxID=104508 RepID=A0AAU9ULX4_EUPED|nr:unnamed protein product [Euphydryas editha]